MAILLCESLNRCFTIDHRSYDIALVAIFLGSDDDIVTITDRSIDHRIANYFEHEELAFTNK